MHKSIIVLLAVIGLAMLVAVPLAMAAEQPVTFAWGQVIVPDFAGWKLYKSETAGGPYLHVVNIAYTGQQSEYQSTQSITAPDNAKTTLYFVITAFDFNGNESEYSNEASKTFDFEAPAVPITFRILVVEQ